MNILITGAGGFTATHLIPRLRLEGDVFLAGTDALAELVNSKSLDSYVRADLTDFRQVVQVMQKTKPDWIFNLAGLARGNAPDLHRVNLMGAINVLEAAKAEAPNAHLLLIGSAAEYGIWPASHMPLSEDHECKPVGAYGLSKYAMTLAAQDYARAGTKVVVARPFNLIGAGMPANLVAGAIAQRIKTALANGDSTITVGNMATERDFVAVGDAVDAYVKLLRTGAWGQVFNICSGQASSIQSVLETLLSFAPRPIEVVEDESLKRPNDPPSVVGDATKARRTFGFNPRVPLYDSLLAAWNHSSESVSASLAGKP
jgi:GDP-4-dehydro-6-deoxy-D-mannose reductase